MLSAGASTHTLVMEQVSDVRLVPCSDSALLKPLRVHYCQNGTDKSCDFVQTHDSVCVLIFNTSCYCFLLVKQFRPAVYMCEWRNNHPGQAVGKEGEQEISEAGPDENADPGPEGEESNPPPASAGMTCELWVGPVDKPHLSLEEIARQEVLKGCGYDVPISKLRRITSCRSAVGMTGTKQTLFYAEVSDEDLVEGAKDRGGAEDEPREVLKVPLHEAMNFAFNESVPKTLSVIFSLAWFHSNMSPKYKISTSV